MKEQLDTGETREAREEAQNALDVTAKLYNYALDRIEEQAKIIKSLEEQIQLIREQYATDRWKELQQLFWKNVNDGSEAWTLREPQIKEYPFEK